MSILVEGSLVVLETLSLHSNIPQTPDQVNTEVKDTPPRILNLYRQQTLQANQSLYSLNKTTLANDLSTERPQWILSAYAPGKDTPSQLFGGYPREQSFEELRVQHYHLAAQGKAREAMQEAQVLVHNAEMQMKAALDDVEGALKYLIDSENQHPNRIDICKAKGIISPQNQHQSVPSQTASSFGQSSNRSPAFGQPSAPTAFGRQSASTFGQPSAPLSNIGGSAASAFGQPSFGQTSTFSRPTTSFGPSATAPGQTTNSAPTFGQPSVSNAAGFPQPAPSTNMQQANPFQPASTSFQSSPFGQSQAPSSNGTFGGAATNQAATGNPFAAKASNNIETLPQTSIASSSPINQTSIAQQSISNDPRRVGTSTNIAKPTSTVNVERDGQGKVRRWNGKAVTYVDSEPCYRGNDGNWQRLWFPDGAPTFVNVIDPADEVYDGLTKEIYASLKTRGDFQNGAMPLLPPKREWCDWNL
ncbi:uncharacterized protein KY384_006014 [Bacidia gigantensis]|uniref:uncharacterized protein n=1 Tax=Bacidia gigantensis TaxID=2732470 RepID=UPI001D04AE0A|nr:uncharacterized protein KY384_006014 [Bacidia gigantensis]KAG8529378.1 hypothetical protein KY384_006014 [Bacidia gigantensis]